MFRKCTAIISVVLACGAPLVTSASAEPQKLTIDEALSGVLSTSPLVREIERNLAYRNAEAIETARLSNPTLDAEVSLPQSWKSEKGDDEVTVSLSQPVKLSHGPLRNRLAALIKNAGDASKEQELLGLSAKVRLAYARVWLLQEREDTLRRIAPKTKSLSDFVASGLTQGAYGKGDAAIFRSEIARTEAELLGLQAERFQSQLELAKLLGRSLDTVILTQPELPNELSVSALEARLTASSLNLFSRARMLVELARADAQVSERDAFPELRPRIFYSRSDAGTEYLGFGISFDLPFYSRNSADRLRKTSELSASQAQLNFLESDDFKRSVTQVARGFNLRREETQIYRTRVLPSMNEALASFEEQVRNGQGSVFQLWQTLQTYLSTQERYLELWTKTFSDFAELSLLVGEEL